MKIEECCSFKKDADCLYRNLLTLRLCAFATRTSKRLVPRLASRHTRKWSGLHHLPPVMPENGLGCITRVMEPSPFSHRGSVGLPHTEFGQGDTPPVRTRSMVPHSLWYGAGSLCGSKFVRPHPLVWTGLIVNLTLSVRSGIRTCKIPLLILGSLITCLHHLVYYYILHVYKSSRDRLHYMGGDECTQFISHSIHLIFHRIPIHPCSYLPLVLR